MLTPDDRRQIQAMIDATLSRTFALAHRPRVPTPLEREAAAILEAYDRAEDDPATERTIWGRGRGKRAARVA